MLPKNMLIIGGSGLVGSTVIQYALPHYNIIATTNKEDIEFEGISVTKIDLLEDRKGILDLIKKLKPDIVINTVALSNVDLCESDPELATLLHVDVTQNIANTCLETNSKLIHFSSEWVFDGKSDRKYNEEDKPNPINHYGRTRLQAENIVLNSSPQNVILRTAVIYGWHKRSRFTNWIIESLREKKIVDPFMDQYNAPTLVDDLAKAILKIIEMNVSGLYHAVGKTCLSRYDFALILAEKFGLDKNLIKPVTSEQKKQVAPRPKKSCLDASKLEIAIGYNFCDVSTGVSYVLNKSLKSKI